MSEVVQADAYSRRDFDATVGRRVAWAACVALVVQSMALMVGSDLWNWPWGVVPLSALTVTIAILVMILIRRFLAPALALIVAACIGIVSYLVIGLGCAEALALLCVPVALVAVCFGPWVGALTALGASAWVGHVGQSLAPGQGRLVALAILLIWGVVILLWIYRRSALEIVDWAWREERESRQRLDEALTQRVVLKQTQEDLQQANVQLERLSERLAMMTRIAEEARQAKESFLASVSHELRTPLNMIIGFSEMITDSPEVYDQALPPSLLADIAVIQRNSQHLASLVDDILDLSRSDAGRVALNKEWVTLDEVIQAAEVAVRPLFESKGLYLRVNIAQDAPPIYCDRTRVRQVILNLLSNAGRFTTTGGVEVRVAREEDWVLCSVADTGPGIAPEDRDRVFEPFLQASSSVLRRTDGSGLGLSISKRFVEMHGGRMWLESEVGQGTTVSFRLPVQEPPARTAQDLMRWFGPYTQHEARDRPSRAPLPAVRPRFVVAESSQVVQRMLRRSYYDAEIASVSRLEDIGAALKQAPASAVIVNDASAELALRQAPLLANLPQGTPALICWAPSEHELAERLGVRDYLVKPIERRRLMALLEELGDAVHRVLIVDDDREAVQLLSRMLLSAPRRYEVLRATRAQRALALMRHNRPDLVLLDLVMPELDGYQLLAAQQQDAQLRDIPVVAITGQVAAATFGEGRCLTLVRPANVPLGDLLGRAVAMMSERAGSSWPPADREPPESSGA